MVPEWMLLMDMTQADRETYMRNKEITERASRIRRPSDRKRKRV